MAEQGTGIEAKITEVNQRLKLVGGRVVVEQRGGHLWLRGTLPPKPGSDKRLPHQQRIRLGVRSTMAGLQYAESEAKRVSVALDRKEFDWAEYVDAAIISHEPVVGDLVEQFIREYWRTHQRSDASEYTLKREYVQVFQRLPQDVPLTREILLTSIDRTAPNTRARRRVCLALGQLAKLANVPLDIRQYRGKYEAKERHIPTDEEIIQAWEMFTTKSQSWANVYGLLAVYGLRAHEVFLLDCQRFPILRVQEGKTAARDVYPYPTEWLRLFRLTAPVELPRCNGSHTDLGHRVTTQFRRYEIPFRPHDLRHAHAIRMISYRVPVEVAARYHGHSNQVHTDIYQRWMRQEALDQVWQETS